MLWTVRFFRVVPIFSKIFPNALRTVMSFNLPYSERNRAFRSSGRVCRSRRFRSDSMYFFKNRAATSEIRNKPVLTAFALADDQHPPRKVNIGEVEIHRLGYPEPR